MQMPDILSPETASVSGRSSNGADDKGADASAFGELHRDLMGSGGSEGLKPGDVLRNAEGNVVGRIVRGDGGDLRLALEGREGEGIPLDKLSSLLEDQEGSGLEALQALFSGELDVSPDSGGDWLQQLENLTSGEQQGILAALAGVNGLQGGNQAKGGGNAPGNGGGNGLPLGELLGQGTGAPGSGDGSPRNSTSNFLQNLLSGMALNGPNGQSSEASSTDLRFEGLRLVAVENSGGQESGSRSSEALGLTQQSFTRSEAARDATLRHYTTTVETPVQNQKQWSEQVAGKIAWLAGRSIQSADIQLNPPDMGPIEVRVSVQNDQAQVTVNAQNAQVREMLELNSSRLRDMLEQEGLNLADFDVSGEAAGGDGDEAAEGESGERDGSGPASGAGETVATGESTITLDDGIDTYA
jgi:flagellar hook-length control protein FliK